MLIALLLVVMLIGIPSASLNGKHDTGMSPVGQASASGPGDRAIRVGVPDFTINIGTLNPLLYTNNEEMVVVWPCYSTLLTYDVNKNIVGDLATSWDVSPGGTLWHFKITTAATFYDRLNPTVVHPLTVADIIFTYYLVQNNSNNLQTYLPAIAGQPIISSMWAVNSYEFYIETTKPYAPMRSSLASIPILPEFIWSTERPNWQNFNRASGIPPCVGSGPFYYALDGLPTAGSVELDRSPTWFATQERGWQIKAPKLIFKSETSTDTALTDLRTGAIDIDAYPSAPQYLNTLPGMDGVERWTVVTGALYEFNMNQMSDAKRAAWGGHYNAGTNNQLLLLPVVKDAMTMCIDKPTYVNEFMSGLGSPANSLIGPQNEFHYDYGSRPGETPFVFDPAAARTMLNAAGWNYDLNGNAATSTTAPLCKLGGTDPLRFRFYTPYDGIDQANWNGGAQMIANWTWQAGIDLKTLYSQHSGTFMNGVWASADYDVWLWDWYFGQTSEASTDIMLVLTTGAIGSWSDIYWTNATYNNLYNESLVATDFATRYSLLADMQAMAYEDSGCVPVSYRAELFAASNQGPDRWTNWGNWTQNGLLSTYSASPWLYTQIYPMDNHAPTVTAGSPTFNGYVGTALPVFGSAVDDYSTMKYQWNWGDGTRSGWQTSASQSHTYAKDGIYTAYFAAQEQGTADGYIDWDKSMITVIDQANLPPTISSITMTPSSGIEQGTNVTFTCIASDPNGDPLSYNWDFGDTYTATGQTVYHRFLTAGSYTATLYVDDGHPGPGRPATATKLVSVKINHPPSISIQSSQSSLWKIPTFFNATASDADLDTLRFTWVWGDGSKSVTPTPLMVTHTYSQKGIYNVYVYADDLTGLLGHNVSALDRVTITGTPSPPTTLTLVGAPLSIWVSQTVTFTASAKDPTGDAMRFTINCGDGTYIVVNTPETSNNKLVTVTANHTYWSAGTMTARLYVYDGQDNTTGATPWTTTVTFNSPPVVTPLTNRNIWAGSSGTFTASAVDPDGEPMRYTWNFGDGTPLQAGASTTHIYAKAGIYTYTVYVNDLTGLVGHNVTSSATASIAFNLPLAVGWNFVSVPVVGFGYKASTIGLATGDMISSWAPATQKYDKTYIKGISPASANFTIDQNVGYWVWVAAAKTLHLYGSVPTTTQSYTFTIPLIGGWVALGFESLKTTWKANNISAMYSGTGAITMVAYFNAVTQKYSSWISAVPNLNNFLLVPGVSYWIWVTAGTGGTLSYMP
jgi:ABC-type transport system substrate-binding protein